MHNAISIFSLLKEDHVQHGVLFSPLLNKNSSEHVLSKKSMLCEGKYFNLISKPDIHLDISGILV